MATYKPRTISHEEMAEMARREALEGVYPEEALIGGLKALKAAGQGVKKGVDYFGRPAVKNKVVVPKGNADMLSGRVPASKAEVTHAYRNVSQRELDDILNSSFARRDPTPGSAKRTWSDEGKWWSGGDEAGTFGRKWNKGDATVRTAADKVPGRRAVRAEDMEAFDAEAKMFVPLKSVKTPGKFAKGGVVRDKRDGIAVRGKTKGRVI